MSVPLQGSIRDCKVNTGWANRIESDRFLNPENMVCIPWDGFDSAGRQACYYSFYTKTPGCNSASDRVIIENEVSRPQYIEYIAGNVGGIQGNIYKPPYYYDSMYQSSLDRNATMQNLQSPANPNGTGRFGMVSNMNANIYPNCAGSGGGKYENPSASCGTTAYSQAMAQQAQAKRMIGSSAVMARQAKFMKQAGN